MLWTAIRLNSAILSIPSEKSIVSEVTRKEKRGAFGFSGHHHPPSHHFDDWHNGHHLPPPPPPNGPPLPLGAHFHTTVTKKIGVPLPYPVPVKVSYDLAHS